MTGRPITTDELIESLSKAPLPPRFSPTTMVCVMIVAIGVSALMWVWQMGVRSDLGTAMLSPVTLTKTLLPALVAGLALHSATRSAYPGARWKVVHLVAPVVAALALFFTALVSVPTPLMAATIIGSTSVKCLTSVTMLSLFPMAGGLSVMRKGATTRPAFSGALVGLAAGAGAAAGYSLACTEDSPLFFVVWYGLAILIAGGMGALVGGRVLKW